MSRKMPRFNRVRAASALVDAEFTDIERVAEKYGLSVRTVSSYRSRLDEDQELRQLFEQRLREVTQTWAEDLPAAISSGVDFLKRVSETTEPNTASPAKIRAVAEAVRTLVEIEQSRSIVGY